MSLLRKVFAWVHDGSGNTIDSASGALKVALTDGAGNAVGSLNGAINVHMAGVHNSIINDSFHQHTGVSTTLTVAAAINDTSVTVASVVGFAIGDYIQIGGHTGDITYTRIINIVGLVIYLNRPLGHTRAIGVAVDQIVLNIASTAGTMAAPQSYTVIPSTGEVWHIERLMTEMVHTTAGDLALFGNLTALTNGVILRRYDGATATYNTFTVWQANEDIFLDTASIQFLSRSGGGGSYATVSFGSFADIGVTVKLDASAGDYLEILIQDDLTTLTNFQMKVQGHLEGA